MILTNTSQDVPLNLLPRIESDLMRLWDALDYQSVGEDQPRVLFFVQGIVPQGIAPVIQPPKEVDQVSEVIYKQEALISFFTSERGADRFRAKLVKKHGYKESHLTVSTINTYEVLDLVESLNYDLESDFGIGLRAEVYYVRNDVIAIGDIIFSPHLRKN